jgi:glycosyltransferase involved in cell wall biosynthesis
MRKKDAWADVDFTLVSPSNWLATEARRSSLMAHRKIMVIPYGIDLSCFSPGDKLKARRDIGISNDKFVIAFGAARLEDSRKGLDLLWGALQDFSERGSKRNCELLVFGAGGWNPPGSAIPIRNAGMIDDDRKLAHLYSAADVFCAPSREENLANTALESLGCGIPVLAFKIGGFPDIIDHRQTGFLANPFDVRSLSDGLEFLYSSHLAGEDFRASCRARAERLYDGKVNANRYLELYNNLISSDANQTAALCAIR